MMMMMTMTWEKSLAPLKELKHTPGWLDRSTLFFFFVLRAHFGRLGEQRSFEIDKSVVREKKTKTANKLARAVLSRSSRAAKFLSNRCRPADWSKLLQDWENAEEIAVATLFPLFGAKNPPGRGSSPVATAWKSRETSNLQFTSGRGNPPLASALAPRRGFEFVQGGFAG